jgi:lipid-binding SYLF domain-containing protein
MGGLARILLLIACLLPAMPARAYEQQQRLVDRARETVETLLADPDFAAARARLQTARGVLIVPQPPRGGLVIGAEGGLGVLLARDLSGRWSHPAFYSIAAGAFGIQLGIEAKATLFIIATDRGLDALTAPRTRLGKEVSIAAAPLGSAVAAIGADIVAFSKTSGLFGGAPLEGAVIRPKDDYNALYYQEKVTARQILIGRTVTETDADELRRALGGR